MELIDVIYLILSFIFLSGVELRAAFLRRRQFASGGERPGFDLDGGETLHSRTMKSLLPHGVPTFRNLDLLLIIEEVGRVVNAVSIGIFVVFPENPFCRTDGASTARASRGVLLQTDRRRKQGRR